MKPKLIKTESDYQAALARIEAIFDAKPGAPEGDELDLLCTLVEIYEEKAFPIGLPSPVEVLLQEMGARLPSDAALEEGRHFPVAEMVRRGWFVGFQGTVAEAKSQLEDLLNSLVGKLGPDALVPALNRQHVRDGSAQDEHALRLASEALIPEAAWKAAKLTPHSHSGAVLAFAEKLRISPSIPAGRVRYESKNYQILKPLIGARKVRTLFGMQDG